MSATSNSTGTDRGDADASAKPRIRRYKEIADRISAQIDAGVFLPDEKLPSVRSLVESERISMSTATRALVELETRGKAYARQRAGYFVRPRSKDRETVIDTVMKPFEALTVAVNHRVVDLLENSAKRNVLPLGSAVLDSALIPKSQLNRVLISIAKNSNTNHAAYTPPPGLFELRCGIARIMGERGVLCGPDDIIITAGDSIATELALRAVARPGDCVAIETPTYFGILQAIETAGLKAIEIATDPNTGIDLSELERAIHTQRISCILLNPTLHNPLGYTMPAVPRQKLVALLAKERIPLIEDDVFYDLYTGGQAPKSLKSYDQQGLVLYCSSFSKVLVPGYRIGWCLPGRHYRTMMYDILSRNISMSHLPQIVLSEFLRKGYYKPHVAKLREMFASYPEQINKLVMAHFPTGTQVTCPAGGYIYWIELPTPIDMQNLYEAALASGISITPGAIFFASGISNTAFRICLGQRLTPRIEQAVQRLGELCRELLHKQQSTMIKPSGT